MTRSRAKPSNPRNQKPLSLHPLSVEEALRKAMGAPTRADEPKSAKPKKRKKAKK